METEKHIVRYISDRTGWSRDKVEQALEAASEKGISPEEYVQFSCWAASAVEADEISALLRQVHARREQEEEWLLQVAHRRCLRPAASIRREMAFFKEHGIPPVAYVKRGLYHFFKGRHAKKKAVQRKNQVKKKGPYFEKICKATGWSPTRAEIEITKAWLNCGADPECFFRFRMHERTAREQKTYLTREHHSKMVISFGHPVCKYFLDTKSWFDLLFSPYIKRRWFLNRHLSYGRFLKKIRGVDAVLIKPVSTTHGNGIQRFSCDVEDKKGLYDAIMALPKSVVEEYIVQHPDVAAFCSTSVNTVRIVTLNDHGTCRFLFAYMRMGRGAIVDNVHSGGLAAGVDPATGVIFTDGIDANDDHYAVHPCSGLPIKGFQIPNWDAVTGLCRKCYNRIPGVRLVGWDIAITADGADLIEGNSGPSFITAQALALQQGKGLRPEVADPYLPGV